MSIFSNGAKQHSHNYRIMLIASTVLSIAAGLFSPFWIVFIEGFGDVQTIGIAFGWVILANAISGHYAGRLSDRIGRKRVMMIGGYAQALAVFCFTLVVSLGQLYSLQIAIGIIGGLRGTATEAFMGDITERETRGHDLGRLGLVTGVAQAAALFIGGTIAKSFGVETIFYVVAVTQCVATTSLYRIKEIS